MKTIVIFAPLIREMTGGARSILNFILQIRSVNWRPILVSDTWNPLAVAVRDAGIRVILLPLDDMLVNKGGAGLRYSMSEKIIAIRSLKSLTQDLKTLLCETKADCLWVRNVKNVLFAGPAAKKCKIPIIWDIGLELPSRGVIYLIHCWALRKANAIVTQYHSQSVSIFGKIRSQLFKHKFHAIIPGMESELMHQLQNLPEKTATTKITILCTAILHPRKNQMLLLKAAAPILKRHPCVSLKFAGSAVDAKYATLLRNFVQDHHLEDSVEFLGWVNDIPALMNEAQIFVLPSKDEGLPQVIREAMVAGLAVIASDVGALSENINHNVTGLLFTSGDTEQLREHLEALISGSKSYATIGAAARVSALQRFSQEKWTNEYRILLDELVPDKCQSNN